MCDSVYEAFMIHYFFLPLIWIPKVLLTISMNKIRVFDLSFSNVYLQEPNVRGTFEKVQRN